MATDPTTIPSVEDLQKTKQSMNDIDTFVDSGSDSFTDNNGQTRKTLKGIENEAEQRVQQAVENTGYYVAFNFVDGGVVTARNQLVRDNDGKVYKWGGSLPHVVTSGSSPTPEAENAWRFMADNHDSLIGRENINSHPASAIQMQNGESVEEHLSKPKKIIYVSTTINNPSANPPMYDSLASAMASITDNSYKNQYEIHMLSGIHDAREILLKDFVDIVRSPLSSSEVIIEHNFTNLENFKNRDIFKTANTPYDATDDFPIRCKLRGLIVRGINLNYALHGDFNKSPEIDIQADDCIFFNGDNASDALTADYGVGLGVYGRQNYTFNRCDFYGRYDAAVTDETRQQGAGWVVHNRLNQDGPCSVTFNDCNSLKGWYGGRIVDYASGHQDIISINGGSLRGEFADLLCFSLVEAETAPSLTVTGNVPIRNVRTRQTTSTSTYECHFPVVISGFSDMFRAGSTLEIGDLVKLNAYQTEADKALASTRYRYALGAVINNTASGGRVSVQYSGLASVKFSDVSIASNVEVTNSSTVDGKVATANSGDGVIGATIVSTGFTTGIHPNMAWISLGYAGVKS